MKPLKKDPVPELELELLFPAPVSVPVDTVPTPPPKIVVEPTVVVKVREPDVSTDTIAEVVIAEEDAPPIPVPELETVLLEIL